MEQKENKQKTQAAEDQVSCPPQQPVEPHPFISSFSIFNALLYNYLKSKSFIFFAFVTLEDQCDDTYLCFNIVPFLQR